MKALQYTGNHSFELIETEKQPLQKGEVRLKMAYVGVCGTDVHISRKDGYTGKTTSNHRT